MFKKVKNILGIEGVKMELMVPETVKERSGKIDGKLKFTSLSNRIIKKVEVILIERYSRGRQKNKLIDEYKLGTILLEDPIEIKPSQIIEIEFELPFVTAQSEMDRIGKSNVIFKGLVKAAKLLRKVKSEYRIEAKAFVRGTKLNPTAKKKLKLI